MVELKFHLFAYEGVEIAQVLKMYTSDIQLSLSYSTIEFYDGKNQLVLVFNSFPSDRLEDICHCNCGFFCAGIARVIG